MSKNQTHQNKYFISCKEDDVLTIKQLLYYYRFSAVDLRAGYGIACKLGKINIVEFYLRVYLKGHILKTAAYVQRYEDILWNINDYVLKQGWFYACQNGQIELMMYFVAQLKKKEKWRGRFFLVEPDDI